MAKTCLTVRQTCRAGTLMLVIVIR